MSNFQQAIKWMKEGKKVRRKLWQNSYMFLNKSKGEGNYKIEGDMLSTMEHLSYYSFEATDWEIYGEEINLEKKSFSESISYIKAKFDVGEISEEDYKLHIAAILVSSKW